MKKPYLRSAKQSGIAFHAQLLLNVSGQSLPYPSPTARGMYVSINNLRHMRVDER